MIELQLQGHAVQVAPVADVLQHYQQRIAIEPGLCDQFQQLRAMPAVHAALKLVPGLEVEVIESGCCGMAGSFGYQSETQDASRAMAEAGLLPAVRAAGAEDLIVADGTSCRHQISDLGGRRAVHSVVVLARALAAK